MTVAQLEFHPAHKTGRILMPDDIDQLKTDVRLILERVTEIRVSAATVDEKVISALASVSRAHKRLDGIDSELKSIQATQNRSAWITHLATALLVSAVTTIIFTVSGS